MCYYYKDIGYFSLILICEKCILNIPLWCTENWTSAMTVWWIVILHLLQVSISMTNIEEWQNLNVKWENVPLRDIWMQDETHNWSAKSYDCCHGCIKSVLEAVITISILYHVIIVTALCTSHDRDVTFIIPCGMNLSLSHSSNLSVFQQIPVMPMMTPRGQGSEWTDTTVWCSPSYQETPVPTEGYSVCPHIQTDRDCLCLHLQNEPHPCYTLIIFIKNPKANRLQQGPSRENIKWLFQWE